MANKNLGEVDAVSAMSSGNSFLIEADGSVRRITLDRMMTSTSPSLMKYLEGVYAYGIEFDTAKSSPDCTRIGNMGMHVTLPIHEKMKGCLLSDSGVVNEYLSASGWAGHTLDGSNGQVMVELPHYYRKFETEGTKRRVLVSEYPLFGYHEVKKKYVSAYEATVQSGDRLASVKDGSIYGGPGTADTKYAGVPRTGISLTNFRTYARNRNGGSDTRWNCMTYDIQKDIYWLFVIEYATLNSQKAYEAQPTSEGYRNGGLGAGVTTITSGWSEFNGYNPFIKCGHTDELGNGTGQKSYKVTGYPGTPTVQVPRYRGIENPFGHIWQWTDGVLVEAGATSDTNLHKVFVCEDPAKFASSIGDGYSYAGNQARTDGYGKEHIFGEGGEIIASVVGGSNTTYLCDYNYQTIPEGGKAVRGVLFGGGANDGANAGLACARSNNAPSYAAATLGSRLCFIPE